jgi:protein TonB
VRNPEVPPVALETVPPVYSRDAARARVSGVVILEVLIERDGRVSGARVLKPLPFGMTEAAIAAVRRWKFRPGSTNAKPVRTLSNITVVCRPPG